MTPRVTFQDQAVHVSVPAEAAADSAHPPAAPPDAVSLTLEIYRAVQPAACSWQRTSRGIMIRLRKQARGHWPRLLKAEGTTASKGRLGTVVAPGGRPRRAARLQQRRVPRRNAARLKAIGELRPRFDGMLQEFAAVRERDEYLEPKQVEMLPPRRGDPRPLPGGARGRTALLGDAPLPAGVDEESLERALLKLRELERGGELNYNRNTASWKEFNRRQKLRREEAEAAQDKERRRSAACRLSSSPCTIANFIGVVRTSLWRCVQVVAGACVCDYRVYETQLELSRVASRVSTECATDVDRSCIG